MDIRRDGIYVDATLGGGGHSLGVVKRLGNEGVLIGIDQDATAIYRARDVLGQYGSKVRLHHGSFFDVAGILQAHGIARADGFLVDLGVSSFQLDEPERGFSYMNEGRLDMRMDQAAELSAYGVVNGYEEHKLAKIIYRYGEERWAKRIARFISIERSVRAIETTGQLVGIIKKAIPAGAREGGPHPAKRTFQAIRIEVNREIELLEQALLGMARLLRKGGRLCVISFHSLEDRIVKNAMRSLEGGCNCPRDFPVCICNPERVLKIVTKKPIVPSTQELEANHRARSAKLRVAVRV